MIYLPGDIVFFKGPGWISRTIRKMSRTSGEARTQANHVGIIVAPGDEQNAVIVEALNKVRVQMLGSRKNKKSEVAIFRPRNISDEKLKFICLRASRYINRSYGYVKIALHALDRAAGGRYWFRRLGRMDRYPICSYLVAQSYASVGLDFGVPAGQAQPDDIWDFCLNHSDKYKLVRSWKSL